MYLKPMRALVKLAPVFRRDAVDHARGVKGAYNFAGPLFPLQQPAQQDRENFVRIDEAAIFSDGANAVGIAIGREAGIALFADDRLLQFGNVRLNRLGIDAREKRVQLLPDGKMLDAALAKHSADDAAAGAVHGVDSKLELCLGNEIDVGELAGGSNVRLA